MGLMAKADCRRLVAESLPKCFGCGSAALCPAYVSFGKYVRLFPPSLQWVPWPLLAKALRFPTFTGTMRS